MRMPCIRVPHLHAPEDNVVQGLAAGCTVFTHPGVAQYLVRRRTLLGVLPVTECNGNRPEMYGTAICFGAFNQSKTSELESEIPGCRLEKVMKITKRDFKSCGRIPSPPTSRPHYNIQSTILLLERCTLACRHRNNTQQQRVQVVELATATHGYVAAAM